MVRHPGEMASHLQLEVVGRPLHYATECVRRLFICIFIERFILEASEYRTVVFVAAIGHDVVDVSLMIV